MLPRLPGVKTAIFTRTLVVFDKTFAPLRSESITFKYLITGHTFMFADAFYAKVERK